MLSKELFVKLITETEIYLSRQYLDKPKESKKPSKDVLFVPDKSEGIESIFSQEVSRESISSKLNFDGKPDKAKKSFMDLIPKAKEKAKNLYLGLVEYFSSKYKPEKENIQKKDCWQVGMDISSVCNFIFFPKKMKKVVGIMIDKGIMVDYINPAPAYCNF